jgi:RNA polymerase sigma-70 factor (ECF subfamily)
LRGAAVDTLASPTRRDWAEDLVEEHNAPATGGVTAGLSVDLAAALGAAQGGEEAGFVALYRDAQPRLLRYATVLVGRDSAEDVTAEAWLQISRDLHRFSGDVDRFRGWAATIVHHRAMDLCRANARHPPVAPAPDGDGDEPAGARDTAACALDALSTDTALGVIAALPREQAQAVLLRAVVGLDARAAGAVLGKRAGAVRVAAHRGLKKLAQQARYHPEEGRWTLV